MVWEVEEIRLCCDIVYPICDMCPLVELCVVWRKNIQREREIQEKLKKILESG